MKRGAEAMNRPHIICHMTTSIDGKVTGKFLSSPDCGQTIESYYQINRDFQPDAFACGRVTMEESFTGGHRPDYTPFAHTILPREDHIADPEASFFAVAFDRRGRLGWNGPVIVDDDPGYNGAHIVEVLCEDTPDSHLAYFRSVGVSYIFAGKDELDLPLALEKLHRLFGIYILMLEGGSDINGAFQRTDLIDWLSLVVAPITAEAADKPLFQNGGLQTFRLTGVTPMAGNSVWLQYQREPRA